MYYEAAKAQTQSEADRDKLTPQHLGAFVKGSEWDKWASTLNASLGRYVLKGKGPKYDTDTCEVFKAVDVKNDNQKVRNTPLLKTNLIIRMGSRWRSSSQASRQSSRR